MVASQSDSAPLITVFGATGNMGGSTVAHLLASDKPYRIRAITRSPEQAKSKELASKGVEVVKGDFESESELTEAIKGADFVFVRASSGFKHATLSDQHDSSSSTLGPLARRKRKCTLSEP